MRIEPIGATQLSITRLLGELEHGSRDALDALVPLLYDELRSLAHWQRLRWRGSYTLGTTALLHEAYLKLVKQRRVVASDRAHFFALASRAMRHILCNYARDRHAMKRGGAFDLVELDGSMDGASGDATSPDGAADRLLVVNAALARLEAVHPRRSRVVECRFFGGMTVQDTAAALGIAPRTVKRDWAAAQDWLRREIGRPEQDERAPQTLDELAAAALPPLLAAFSEADRAELAAGERVGQYEIVATLGRGGMGVVYKAYDARLDRHVALKFLPSPLAADATARKRLMDEARAASALDHPNICTVYDIGELDDGPVFLALAYYAGETLEQKVRRGPLALEEAIAITRQIAQALGAAHRRGIIHRDVKPSNVMVTDEGTVKILDFGIAKLRDGDVPGEAAAVGTLAYMSPEQTTGAAADARADLWSLGVVMYEMLTGRRPFERANPQRLVQAIRAEPFAPAAALRPDLPAAVARIIETCLQKAPAARYPDADALLAELRALGGTDSAAAHALYLKGRYFLNKRDRANIQHARDCFQQALDLDPLFPQAWAGLADAFTVLGGYLLLQPDEAYPRARAAAEQALALDDGLADAHASLATILADHYRDWRAAGQHYRRALALNPGYATARLWYAGFLRDLGQFDEALVQVRAARELDPLSLPAQAAEGITLYVARRYPEAVAVYRRLLEITPTFTYAHFLLALALTQERKYAEALAALQQAEQWGGAMAGVQGISGHIHAELGRDDEARRCLEALDRAAGEEEPTRFPRAVIHIALGETTRALDLLEEAHEAREKQVRLFRVEPLLDPLRAEPRFLALLESVGLTDDAVARALAP